MDRIINGKCRRKLSPEHALFAAGNVLRITKYYQSMGVSGPEEEQENEDTPPVFVCRLLNCQGVGFRSLRAYEEHYDLIHRNVCRECFRSFLSVRLLDLHLSETHDAYFRVLAKRQPMYACLVGGCVEMFKHDDKRTKHLVADHQYPPTFSFHRVRRSRPSPPAKARPHKPTEAKKDADAIKIAKAHARKLKRREKKKSEARERKQAGGDELMDTSERFVEVEDENATEDQAMQEDAGGVGELAEQMKQLMVPTSISFGRRPQQRR